MPTGLAVIAVALATAGGAAQDTTATACDCGELLRFTVEHVEANYAGFEDKGAGSDAYGSLVTRLRSEAERAEGEAECAAVLEEYVAFFEDRHFSLRWEGEPDPPRLDVDSIRALYADAPSVEITEPEVRERLASGPGDAIEGVWEVLRANYRLAVVPSGAPSWDFDAVVLRADSVRWVPGQVMARFRVIGSGRYHARVWDAHHEPSVDTARIREGLLAFDGVTWLRDFPVDEDMLSIPEFMATLNLRHGVRQLDEETALIQLPSFDARFQGTVDSMVAANEAMLRDVETLIIDVRGNGGGSDLTYRPVLPFLYTGPIVNVGVDILATPDNIQGWVRILEQPGLPEDVATEIRALVDRLRTSEGGWVTMPDDTIRLEAALSSPRRVAVLMDGGCGSSCEQFVLTARQSDKVTLYGSNTIGSLDYSNVLPVSLPCDGFTLRVPTSRSRRLPDSPVDPDGIAPDVRIPDDVLVPLDWVRGELREGGQV